MPIQKLILTYIVLASALLGSVFAADKPVVQADVDKLQEQVRTLDKELAVQREAFVRKLDDVEKRQSEITAQQANSLAAISNQTTALGNYIAYTSAAITVIVFIAGIATYFSAKNKAEKEARVASAKWFDLNALHLNGEIEKLKSQAREVAKAMDTHELEVAAKASLTSAKLDEAAHIIFSARAFVGSSVVETANEIALQTVREASAALKSKPESEFLASDYYARGLDYYSTSNFQSALAAFEDAVELSNLGTPPKEIGQYLTAKGIALSHLGRAEEATAVFDQIDQRFSQDMTPGMRELSASWLNGAGYGRLIIAKKHWLEVTLRTKLLNEATACFSRSRQNCRDGGRAMIVGNLGYSLFLEGQYKAAESSTLECLQLGGQRQFDYQLEDAKLNRVDPEDSQYEELLTRLWRSLPPTLLKI